MIFKGDVVFLGREVKKSKKTDKEYLSILVMQGTDTFSCLSEVDIQSDFGKSFTGIFEFNPKYSNLKLVGVEGGDSN